MSATKPVSTVRYLGSTDDVTTCECCGRADLKSTVALRLTEDSEPVYFGVTCAAKALSVGVKEIKAATAKADREKAEREAARVKAIHDKRFAAWSTFLKTQGTATDRNDMFRQIESLGGYNAAREAFKASVYYNGE